MIPYCKAMIENVLLRLTRYAGLGTPRPSKRADPVLYIGDS